MGVECSHSLEADKNKPLCPSPRGASQASIMLHGEEESYYRHLAKHWSRLPPVSCLRGFGHWTGEGQSLTLFTLASMSSTELLMQIFLAAHAYCCKPGPMSGNLAALLGNWLWASLPEISGPLALLIQEYNSVPPYPVSREKTEAVKSYSNCTLK